MDTKQKTENKTVDDLRPIHSQLNAFVLRSEILSPTI